MLFSVFAFAQQYIKLFSGSTYADLGVDLVQDLPWPTQGGVRVCTGDLCPFYSSTCIAWYCMLPSNYELCRSENLVSPNKIIVLLGRDSGLTSFELLISPNIM